MKKIISILLATCMLFAIVACGNGSAKNGSVGSAELGVENNEVISASDLNAETANVHAADGMYTYTLYEGTENEMTLSMGVNIDDYILDGFFSVGLLAGDLGWLKNNDPNYDSSNDNLAFWSYDYGDGTMMVFTGYTLPQYDISSLGIEEYCNYQLAILNVYYAPVEDFGPDTDNPFFVYHMYRDYQNDTPDNLFGIGAQILYHPDSVEYSTVVSNGERSGVSRDDIIIIAYILWSARAYPTENCFYYSELQQFCYEHNSPWDLYYLP